MEIGFGMGLTSFCGKASGPFADPLFTQLLLHLDSDFSDSSLGDRTPTLVGSPTVSSVQKVFGAKSYLSTPSNTANFSASTDFNLGDSVPAQVSFRVWSDPARADDEVYFATHSWSGNGYLLAVNHTDSKLRFSSNSTLKASWDYTFPTSTWIALRFNHDGAGTYRYYVNGILLAAVSGVSLTDSTNPFFVGARTPNVTGLTGYMDEVLWEKHADLVVTTSATYDVEIAPWVNP